MQTRQRPAAASMKEPAQSSTSSKTVKSKPGKRQATEKKAMKKKVVKAMKNTMDTDTNNQRPVAKAMLETKFGKRALSQMLKVHPQEASNEMAGADTAEGRRSPIPQKDILKKGTAETYEPQAAAMKVAKELSRSQAPPRHLSALRAFARSRFPCPAPPTLALIGALFLDGVRSPIYGLMSLVKFLCYTWPGDVTELDLEVFVEPAPAAGPAFKKRGISIRPQEVEELIKTGEFYRSTPTSGR